MICCCKTDEALPYAPPRHDGAASADKERGKPVSRKELETNFSSWAQGLLISPVSRRFAMRRNAVIGTTSIAVDISERKANEDQLRLLLGADSPFQEFRRASTPLPVSNRISTPTRSRVSLVPLQRATSPAIGRHVLLRPAHDDAVSLRMLVEQQLVRMPNRLVQIAIMGGDAKNPRLCRILGSPCTSSPPTRRNTGSLSMPCGQIKIQPNPPRRPPS